jgi:predicted O-linked N-acetylglucosamine transferase (SPINDLY family)
MTSIERVLEQHHCYEDGPTGLEKASGIGCNAALVDALEQTSRVADIVVALQEHSNELQRKYDELLEQVAEERQRAQILLEAAEERAEASRVEARFFELRLIEAHEQLAQITSSVSEQFAPAPRTFRLASPPDSNLPTVP